MKKINLEEILNKFDLISENEINGSYERNEIKKAMLQFGKQLLELAAENSKIEIKSVGEELVVTDVYQEDHYTRIQVNIESILDIIKQVE